MNGFILNPDLLDNDISIENVYIALSCPVT